MEVWDERVKRYVNLPDEEATAIARRSSRYDGQQNLVPALPERRSAPVAYPMPAQPDIVHTGSAQQVISEATSPIKRAGAAMIASTWFTVIALVILGIVVWVGLFDATTAALLLLVVLGASAVVYAGVYWLEQVHSPAGVALNDRNKTHAERMAVIDRHYDLAEKVAGVDHD